MEKFNTLEKVQKLFESLGCESKENCYFVTFKDNSRAKSGLVGGMEYPYDGVLINKTEKGFGILFLRYEKMPLLKADISKMIIPENAYQFIPNEEISKVTVKKHSPLSSKVKSIVIKTVDRKHCLVANVNEPLIPYHNENLAKFASQYEK